MASVFGPADTARFRAALLALPTLLGGVALVWGVAYRSPYYTRVGMPIEQPVPFSHEHHVGQLGIDCRYCHASVERSAFAGMPSTKTCMRCHSQIWRDSAMLAPVRDSYRSGLPLRWNRIDDLPDYVFFDHGIHVTKGVACVSCHGRIDRMPLAASARTLHMRWCIECHKDPRAHMGSPEHVFDMDAAPRSRSAQLATLDRSPARLVECGVCHR